MEFDLSKYTLSETSVLDVLDTDNEAPLLGQDDKPVTIELFGPGSDIYVKALAARDRAMQKIGMQSAFAMNKGKEPQDTAPELKKINVAYLTACTKAVNNFPVKPEEIYGNPGLVYITRQVERFLGDIGNFSKQSTRTSSST